MKAWGRQRDDEEDKLSGFTDEELKNVRWGE